MIITKIHIKDHQQFKDLELNLTYPLGHEKAGQALDKVCFIGQSGTGKTTLLEEIWDFLDTSTIKQCRNTLPVNIDNIHFHTQLQNINGFDKKSDLIELVKLLDAPDLLKLNFVYFNIQNELVTKSKNIDPVELFLENDDAHNSVHLFFINFKNNGWEKIQKDIEIHQQEITKYAFAISKAFKNNDYKLAEKHSKKLKAWEKENETPLSDLAENYLNPILKDFALEVKVELESLEEINQINLINKKLETIPQQFWSTGIKNIIARTIPLYTHKFENSIICIDEPETSLYPDIQRKIIDIYSRLAPNNQFFYATHSPIIASSFEPWEIVELKFDKEGYVYREQYWEGENHVDNYKYDPRYLRWDSILQNIFDLENDGSDERKEMLQDFANLDNQLKERKRKEGKLSKEDPEVKKLMEMGKKLGWDTKQGTA